MRGKSIIFVIIFIIVILALGFVLLLYFQGPGKEEPQPNEPRETSEPAETINSFEECAAAGYPIMESYPRKCSTPEGQTFVEDIGNELEKQDLIRVDSPRPNQIITSPLTINGQARGTWFFEASFPIKLVDENGKIVALTIAQAQSEWMTEEFVPFLAKLEFQAPANGLAVLILQKDNPSGRPEFDDELKIPVRFIEEDLTIKAYFNNDRLDPEFSCNKVFPVERKIAKTKAVARAALEELLKGPTDKEKADGFVTNINPGVKINKITIENGVAKVDFDEQLEFQVGGSCRVAAISAQITQTLKQFSSVKNVIISINGRTEDILQP